MSTTKNNGPTAPFVSTRGFNIAKFKTNTLSAFKAGVLEYSGQTSYKYSGDKYEPVLYTTDMFKLRGGIPKMPDLTKPLKQGEKKSFITGDKDRLFFRLFVDETQQACKDLKRMLSEIDDHMLNHTNQSKLIKGQVTDILKYTTNPKEFIFKAKYFRMLSTSHHEDEVLRIDNKPVQTSIKFNSHEDVFLSTKGFMLIKYVNQAIKES